MRKSLIIDQLRLNFDLRCLAREQIDGLNLGQVYQVDVLSRDRMEVVVFSLN